MRVDVWHGKSGVRWNDQGDAPYEITLNGTMLMADQEEALRDLYKVLAFLFERPAP